MDVLNEWLKAHRNIERAINGREIDGVTERNYL